MASKEGQVSDHTLLTVRYFRSGINLRESRTGVMGPGNAKFRLANVVVLRTVRTVMESKDSYLSCPETNSPKVSEGTSVKRPVIPLVSREEAERVFSSQRLMSWEEKTRQIDLSLGRLRDSG